MSSLTKLRRRALRWHRYSQKVNGQTSWWRSQGQQVAARRLMRELARRDAIQQQRWWADLW